MKLPSLNLTFVAALLLVLPSHAFAEVKVRASIISLPEATATQFTTQHDLTENADTGLKALEALVAERRATVVATPSITTKSGVAGRTKAGKVVLYIEPVIAKGGESMDIRIILEGEGRKLDSTYQVGKSAVRFLGSTPNPKDKTKTDLIFVKISY